MSEKGRWVSVHAHEHTANQTAGSIKNGEIVTTNQTLFQERPMSKTYVAPALVAKGDVVKSTAFGAPGIGDPIIFHTLGDAPGNVGFQL
jgi:hypothetical protein